MVSARNPATAILYSVPATALKEIRLPWPLGASQASSSLATRVRDGKVVPPVYAARAVSKLLVQVSTFTWPEMGAVHLYHTEFSPSDPPAEGRWSGSPNSLEAAPFMPDTLAPVPLISLGKLKRLLGGLTRAASAMLILSRVTVPPARVSVTGVPVICKSCSMLETVFPASFCSSSAHAPETWGAAMEVPLMVPTASSLNGSEERMPTPGA